MAEYWIEGGTDGNPNLLIDGKMKPRGSTIHSDEFKSRRNEEITKSTGECSPKRTYVIPKNVEPKNVRRDK